jgi:hypothetical protein
MKGSQFARLAAMLLIGDGIYAMVRPQQEGDPWWMGPKTWKRLVGHAAAHPNWMRGIGATQAALSLAWLIYEGDKSEKQISPVRKFIARHT